MPQNSARKYGKTPAQILLRWNVQQGIIPIPKSKNPARLAENIAVFDFAPEGGYGGAGRYESKPSYQPRPADF